jgi:hypothetical protein
VFSDPCPFPESEKLLVVFWQDHLVSGADDSERPFGHEYQDSEAACLQYLCLFEAIRNLKSPVRRLLLDLVPFTLFELLPEFTIEVSLNNVRDLHMVIVMDSLVEPSSFERGFSVLSRFLGNMSGLQTLGLGWLDANEHVTRSLQSDYMETWRIF